MQRFSSREDVLLGYSPRKTLMDPSSSPETPRTSSDIDFDDVFGGPPRQPSSIQDTRYGFGENNSDSSFTFGRSDEPVRRNPLSSLSEKPVFGEEVIARRRRWKSDFFDDIFRGKVSLSSSPKKYEMKDPFAPGLQLLKPAARPFPPEAEPSGNSFPAYSRQPSLPAKINKLMDLPTFRSFTRTKPKSNDISSNGLSYYASSPMYVGSEIKGNSNEDLSSSEISKNGTQFHFSIHKWANKGGIPIAIPLRGNDRLNGKGKLQRCSSANGWIEKEQKDRLDNRFCSIDEMSSNFKSFGVEHGKNGNVGSVIDSRNEDGQLGRIIEEDHMSKSESEIMNKHKSTVDKVSQGEVTTVGKATPKPQPKPLNVLLNEDDNDDELGNDKITRNPESKDMTEMSSEKLSEILDNTNSKKQGVKKKVTSNKVEASTRSIKHFPRKSWDNGKARVRGKVKELIKMFNQDASSKPKMDAAVSENHGSSGKERNTVKPETEPNISTSKIHPNNVLKKKSYSDIPVSSHMYNGASEKNIDGSVKDTVSDGSKTIVEEPEELFEDNFLVEDVTPEVEILPESGIDPEETKVIEITLCTYIHVASHFTTGYSSIQAIDNKIRQWSNGKQSNIRSLLSTLQYVLWPNSGWKPVPLVDIIEGLAVKRAYQKALLCLHPDKLQQKGAASDQKYIAQQVFDILQDAWTHFNSLASV